MSHVSISTKPTSHVHDWKPIEGRRARYACSGCEAHGYRPDGGGEIREFSMVTHRELEIATTARPVNLPGDEDCPTPRSRKPTLDETERQRRTR